jgi:hypothetical protein
MLAPLAANSRAWLVVGGILLAIAVVIFLIDRTFAWLAKHGAKAMRNDKAAGAMAGVLGEFDGFLRPEKRMVQEEREQRKAETGQTDPSDR